ncbi:MAG: glucoamylase family protein [Bacteroidales bacterium]
MRLWILLGGVMIFLVACKKEEEKPDPGTLQLISVSVGSDILEQSGENTGMATDRPMVARFSQVLDRSTVQDNFLLYNAWDNLITMEIAYLDNDKTISGTPSEELKENSSYRIGIGKDIRGSNGEVFPGLEFMFTTLNPPLLVRQVIYGGEALDTDSRIQDINLLPEFTVEFSDTVPLEAVETYTTVQRGGISYALDITAVSGTTFNVRLEEELPDLRKFRFTVASALGTSLERAFDGLEFNFHTMLDSTYKFPELGEEELLTLVQQQTFDYFWTFGHPVSGLARERNTSGETVTSGGSGFGLMATIVAMERGFITREEGLQRINTMVEFLGKADRFHGAWSHWLNGTTGKVIPFSTYDNGGDLVETSYMAMGLITARQYLDENDPGEQSLIEKINTLWEGIEWSWYTRGGEPALYWHWSPQYEWQMDMKISGYNEALITYVMAASSPTYPIDSVPYHTTWARNGAIVHNQSYYGINLPLSNQPYGGPLFFAHYSFMGLDPRGLSDQYADYWEQVVNHSKINYTYCEENPLNYVGYSSDCWGLTASDGPAGYSAHSPTNDRGVITPTAALSSFPYTPDESMRALKLFYYYLGDRLWGNYGFYDAFCPTVEWWADSFLAIDQGPIIVMIENYRSQLLWELFMSAPEVQAGLMKLGFQYPSS